MICTVTGSARSIKSLALCRCRSIVPASGKTGPTCAFSKVTRLHAGCTEPTRPAESRESEIGPSASSKKRRSGQSRASSKQPCSRSRGVQCSSVAPSYALPSNCQLARFRAASSQRYAPPGPRSGLSILPSQIARCSLLIEMPNRRAASSVVKYLIFALIKNVVFFVRLSVLQKIDGTKKSGLRKNPLLWLKNEGLEKS